MRKIIKYLNGKQKQTLKRKMFYYRTQYHKYFIGKYNYEDFKKFLQNKLKIKKNDHIMIHSSLQALLYWNLSPVQIIEAFKEIITKDGVIIMPTFVTRNSYEYVNKTHVFNVDKTPSQSGLITEIFRRQKDVLRSHDPIKPFSVWGNEAKYYISDHHKSIYSYDKKSPLFKLIKNKGKVLGLGASIQNLTLVHTIENIMGNQFPLKMYDEKNIYTFNVQKSNGDLLTVNKKILLPSVMSNLDIKKFCKNLSNGIVFSFYNYFTGYFICNANSFFEESKKLANKGICVYGSYKN